MALEVDQDDVEDLAESHNLILGSSTLRICKNCKDSLNSGEKE
jgi:hypothetical protein